MVRGGVDRAPCLYPNYKAVTPADRIGPPRKYRRTTEQQVERL
ncbi:hypothetical protein WI0192307A02_CDS0083 [Pseudomonas phage KG853]